MADDGNAAVALFLQLWTLGDELVELLLQVRTDGSLVEIEKTGTADGVTLFTAARQTVGYFPALFVAVGNNFALGITQVLSRGSRCCECKTGSQTQRRDHCSQFCVYL